MLTQCPECQLQVSDKALYCPHCGYPMQPDVKPKPRKSSHKRRRLPNGFGQISEIKGRNLRNPFRAMVTVGKTPEGKPICQTLKPTAYFPTYNDAYAALMEYNRNPYDLSADITMRELFDRWFAEYEKTVTAQSTIDSTKRAWRYCSEIYDMPVAGVRNRHLKGCIEEGKAVISGKLQSPQPIMQNRMKIMFNLMFDYAVEYEIVDKNCARSFHLSREVTKETSTAKKPHMSFTDEEMEKLWAEVDKTPLVDVMLIQCYSGWRPQELCMLKTENINVKNWTFVGGMKTEAGTDRTVPIHSRIRPLVEKRYKDAKSCGREYLFSYTEHTDDTLTYYKYNKCFNNICCDLNLNPEHRPHDGRVRFVSAAKAAGVDEYAIKYIVGHKISDITEKIYTRRNFDWLREEIEKIK